MSEQFSGALPELAPPRGAHLPGLDGLRGVAILMVMGHHLLQPHAGAGGAIHVWMRAFVDCLWMGVDLFFVLSGFLITGILADTLASEHYFLNFYMRRILRIFPLYYAVILVFILCAPMLHIVWGHQLLPLLTYTNRIFIDPHHPGFNFYFGGTNNLVNFWSLAVEEQFYFVWPLLIFLFKRPHTLIPIASLLALASIATRIYLVSRHTAPDVIYVSLACRADSLLVGAILALAVRHGYRSRIISAARPVALLGVATLLFLFFRFTGIEYFSPFMMRFGYTVNALFFASLVALTLNPSGLGARLFTASWLRFFGRYSYGLYIMHSVLPAFYAAPLGALINSITHNLTFGHVIASASAFLIALLGAMLSYHLLEQPFLRLKRFFPSFAPRIHKTAVPAIP
jgi:peptidoglycan/LPS O-acetylase OafA/YrhL